MYRRESTSWTRTLGAKEKDRVNKLENIYRETHDTILLYQSHTLGLFPRGQSKHARVRDNVYCAMSLWALSLAYRHVGWDKGRTYEFEQSAVKCMRGILFCYMRQAHKVEQFKKKQSWENALHARFDYITGDPVSDDDGWGHLQIDGTSLFLLVLSQMTASGVQVVLTKDEVDFVQNLVYYVERAYRTPDFGMWERGSRENTGRRELHASSIGMAKAALNAIHGLNLFGEGGTPFCAIHVDPDAQYRNHVILSTLLPKESSSKETDAALMCIIGFPAFSIENSDLKTSTEKKLKETLEYSYGFKRFVKDGHHTLKENKSQKHYEPWELEAFEGIECQWPLFFIYAFITAVFHGKTEDAEGYWRKLENCIIKTQSDKLIPKLYYHSECGDDVMWTVGSIDDVTGKLEPLQEHMPFLWAQSLYLIARLLRNNLISPSELDPLGLHLPPSSIRYVPAKQKLQFRASSRNILVQIALISRSSSLQAVLATYGIPTQTPNQIEPLTLSDPGEVLLQVYSHLGENKKLGLSGRPLRPIGAIGTSKIYGIFGHLAVFFPTDLNITDFYMSYDIELFIDTVKSILTFLNSYWNMSNRPTVTILLRENLFKGGYFNDMISFLAQIKGGEVEGVKVRLDRLQALIPTSCVDNLEYVLEGDETHTLKSAVVRSPRLRSYSSSMSIGRTVSSSSLTGDDTFNVETLQVSRFDPTPDELEEEPTYGPLDIQSYTTGHAENLLKTEYNASGRLYLLQKIMKNEGNEYLIENTSITNMIEDVYNDAAVKKHWMAVRLGASLLHKVVDCLAPSLSSLLVKEKEITVSVFGFPEHIITEPMTPVEISDIIYNQCMEYEPIEAVLQQEILIYLGDLVTRSDINHVFDGMLRLRIGWIVQAMKNELHRINSDQILYQLSPYEVKQLLRQTLLDEDITCTRSPSYKRQLDGALNRVPRNFYVKVYTVLKRIPGGVAVRGRMLHQQPIIHVMSAHEKNFSIEVEKLLSNITSPQYRQLVVELLMVLSTILERNPELRHKQCINLDELLLSAFSMLERDIKEGKLKMDGHNKESHGADPFYSLPTRGTHGSVSYMAKSAINELLSDGIHYDSNTTCVVS